MAKYKLSASDIKYIKKKYALGMNITDVSRKLCTKLGLTHTDSIRRKVSANLARLGVTKNLEEIKKEEANLDVSYNEAKSRRLKDSKFYIITWEQNNTPLHDNLWKNILKYKEFLNAELSVILGRYKNPTSVFQDKAEDTWNLATRPYWDASRHDIHKYLTILSDVKVQPTAANPLTGLESMTGETTTIIGHPKMWLKPIPVLEGHPKKILLTTGAITVPNYTDSKAGKRGEFNHVNGFVIVEVKDEDVFFIRQVEADSEGNFIDLLLEVKDGEVYPLDRAEAIIWGDTHVSSLNSKLIAPTYLLVERLKIPKEVHHDLLDGAAVNNHLINNPIAQHQRMVEGKDDIEREISGVVQFLSEGPQTQKIIVQANHNDRLDRWINSQDWKKDLKNALPYLKYTTAVLEGYAKKGVLAYLLEQEFSKEEVLCLDYDDSHMISGYEVAHHGHIGSNGSRGNIEQFRKMSTKMVVGHYHAPYRADRVISVGTSTHLREGWNKGASSWVNAHVLLHKNGTTQHLIFVDGEYTTLIN